MKVANSLVSDFNKNSDKRYLDLLAFAAILCVLIGFLFNRVVSNIGFILSGLYAIIKIKDIIWLFKDRWMWTFMALAFLPLLSDIYFEGIDFYRERGIMKLILILFPSFVFALHPPKIYISYLNLMVIITMLISTLYTTNQYFIDSESIVAAYKVSKVMPVLSYGDHIRISWVVVMSMVLAIYEYTKHKMPWFRILMVSYMVIQATFLHYLGSKTGLISLYLTIGLMSFLWIPKGKKWYILIVILLMFVAASLAIKSIPSLKERANFMKYDFEHYSKGEYREGLSDAIRFYSLKAGKDIISEHPYCGVGFSKLQEHTNEWYSQKMPSIPSQNHFLPSSQLVIYWASAGFFGFTVFCLHLLLPFFKPYLRINIWFLAIFVPSAFSFSYETHLEGQLPLFVYSFFISWAWYLAYFDQKHHLQSSEN